jgi:hypothetical protein
VGYIDNYGEKLTRGIVTHLDNPYDGHEAVNKTVSCSAPLSDSGAWRDEQLWRCCQLDEGQRLRSREDDHRVKQDLSSTAALRLVGVACQRPCF